MKIYQLKIRFDECIPTKIYFPSFLLLKHRACVFVCTSKNEFPVIAA